MISTRLLLPFFLLVPIRQGFLSEGKTESDSSCGRETESVTCQCGVFDSTTPDMADSPILQNGAGIVVPCNQTGIAACTEMCIALAIMAKDNAAKMLCSELHERTRPFKPAVFSWHCVNKQWMFTGLASRRALTCHNGIPIFQDEGKKITAREVLRSEIPRPGIKTADGAGAGDNTEEAIPVT